VARLLKQKGFAVDVFEVQFSENFSEDYSINKKRLEERGITVKPVNNETSLKDISTENVIIDAIFGSGLTRPVTGWVGDVIHLLNSRRGKKISVDIASGLFSEDNDENSGAIFQPHYTLTFEFPKLAFMFPGNDVFVGELEVLPIGISDEFVFHESTDYFTLGHFTAQLIHKTASKVSYKNNFGHALVIAGSTGKIGAAVLTAKSTLKSGAGLVTAQIPREGNAILQVSVPEVMTQPDMDPDKISEIMNLDKFQSIGLGPGLGTNPKTAMVVQMVLKNTNVPIVVDADALNILSHNREWITTIPKGSILTPHLGEWSRIHGKKEKDYQRLQSVMNFSKKHSLIVVLKGFRSTIVCPDGEVFFNTTGNPGMATAGSGDVLTGIITGLLAQGYLPKHAALLGTYIHGYAGDLAIQNGSRESVVASDIIQQLGVAFRALSKLKK
jgi:NAD(P)H-hydrate epimerase